MEPDKELFPQSATGFQKAVGRQMRQSLRSSELGSLFKLLHAFGLSGEKKQAIAVIVLFYTIFVFFFSFLYHFLSGCGGSRIRVVLFDIDTL